MVMVGTVILGEVKLMEMVFLLLMVMMMGVCKLLIVHVCNKRCSLVDVNDSIVHNRQSERNEVACGVVLLRCGDPRRRGHYDEWRRGW